MKNIVKSFLLICLGAAFWGSYECSAAAFETGVFPGEMKSNAMRTEHFQVEYDDIMAVQPDLNNNGIADIIENIADYAEHSWEKEVSDLGFQRPIPQGDYLVLILDHDAEYLIENTVGVTTIEWNGTPYMAIDPWQSNGIIKVTIAHEFMHCIQFGYDTNFLNNGFNNQATNFAEATAVWVEDYVYDDVNDYIYYLSSFLDYSDYSVFAGSDLGAFTYGLNIWHKFLSEYFDEGIILDMWENFFAEYSGAFTVHNSVEDAIDDRGGDLIEAYRDFTVWNLAHEDFYEEGENYPDVGLLGGYNSYPVENEMPGHLRYPAVFGSNYIVFDVPEGGGEDFKFTLLKSDEVSMGVTFVPFGSSYDLDSIKENTLSVSDTYGEFVFEKAADYDLIYVIVSSLEFANPSGPVTFDMGYPYEYSADFGDFSEEDEVATGDEELEVDASEDKGDEEITEYVRGSGEFNLSIIAYDDDSVTLSWNRLSELDIDYYVISYGEESGNYLEEKVVDAAWVTASQVSGLASSGVYYFLVEGYSEDDVLLESSKEVAGLTVAFSFPDLNSSDDEFEAVMGLYDLGIIEGYPDGSFQPDGVVNRAELLKLLVEGIGITPDADVYRDCFSDVSDEWYAPYICYAKEQGWVSGYFDGSFKPANTVNKVEALKMLLMVNGYDLDESEDAYGGLPYPDTWPTAWYAVYVEKAFELGILTEEAGEAFEPDAGRTRGEVSRELYSLWLMVFET